MCSTAPAIPDEFKVIATPALACAAATTDVVLVVVTFVSPSETASPATISSLSKLDTNKVLLAPVVDVSPAKFTSPNLIYPFNMNDWVSTFYK